MLRYGRLSGETGVEGGDEVGAEVGGVEDEIDVHRVTM
jgi:hypothetical protein